LIRFHPAWLTSPNLFFITGVPNAFNSAQSIITVNKNLLFQAATMVVETKRE